VGALELVGMKVYTERNLFESSRKAEKEDEKDGAKSLIC
jgi:hypothetical protein